MYCTVNIFVTAVTSNKRDDSKRRYIGLSCLRLVAVHHSAFISDCLVAARSQYNGLKDIPYKNDQLKAIKQNERSVKLCPTARDIGAVGVYNTSLCCSRAAFINNSTCYVTKAYACYWPLWWW